jgi:hypothetical protein
MLSTTGAKFGNQKQQQRHLCLSLFLFFSDVQYTNSPLIACPPPPPFVSSVCIINFPIFYISVMICFLTCLLFTTCGGFECPILWDRFPNSFFLLLLNRKNFAFSFCVLLVSPRWPCAAYDGKKARTHVSRGIQHTLEGQGRFTDQGFGGYMTLHGMAFA